MAVGSGLVSVVVGVVVGGLALFVSGLLVHGNRTKDLEYGVWTAVAGAVVWVLVSWIPLVGGVVALFGWILVIRWRYPGGFRGAVVHGVLAWLVALVLLAVLSELGIDGLSAVGVPYV